MKTDIETKYEYIKQYEQGKLSKKELSEALKLSRQQVYRLLKRYEKQGVIGLYHQGRNKPSNHRIEISKKAEILSLIKEKYYDCGASYASELLAENEGITINRETLRLWMKENNLLIKQRKRKQYRQRRERKTSFGKMLQIDGCFDYWFGRENKKACLINLIDDATSYNLCYFDEQETIRAATIVLWQWIKKWGIPQSIYADRRNAYINYALMESSNFFGNLCKNLKIQTIPAFSPQAKGRIERSNQTHQNRLIPKLRLNNITTIESANKYLKSYYLPYHNKKFALPIISNNHRKLPEKSRIDDYSYELATRKVNNDWTIKYKAKTYQILRKNFCPAKSTISVKETFSGKVILLFKNQELSYKIT